MRGCQRLPKVFAPDRCLKYRVKHSEKILQTFVYISVPTPKPVRASGFHRRTPVLEILVIFLLVFIVGVLRHQFVWNLSVHLLQQTKVTWRLHLNWVHYVFVYLYITLLFMGFIWHYIGPELRCVYEELKKFNNE